MNSNREIIEHYLDVFRSGESDDAFHGLIDLSPDVIIDLIAYYDSALDQEAKIFILNVVAEFRWEVSLTFLKQELIKDETGLWKSALNALVYIGSPASLDALSFAARAVSNRERRVMIMDAVRDTTAAIKERAELGAAGRPATRPLSK